MSGGFAQVRTSFLEWGLHGEHLKVTSIHQGGRRILTCVFQSRMKPLDPAGAFQSRMKPLDPAGAFQSRMKPLDPAGAFHSRMNKEINKCLVAQPAGQDKIYLFIYLFFEK